MDNITIENDRIDNYVWTCTGFFINDHVLDKHSFVGSYYRAYGLDIKNKFKVKKCFDGRTN